MPKNKTKAEILIELEQARKRIAELESSESEKRLRAMLEISQAMSASLEMDTVLQKIVENAAGLLQLESGAIYTLEGDELFLEATTPPLPLGFPDELRHANVADHPHIQTAISSGSSVVLADSTSAELSNAEKMVAEARGLRSIVYVPLMISEKAIGVFIVASVDRVRQFSEEEIALYSGFSGQAAQTIENVRLFGSERENAAKLETQIAERRQAEEKLRDSEERLRQIADNVGEVVWMFDNREQKLVYLNAAYEKTWGRSIEETYQNSQNYIDAIHPEDRNILFAALERQGRGERTEMEYRVVHSNGSIYWISDRSFPIYGEDGALIRTTGIATDITARKQAESNLRASEERMRLATETTHLGIWEWNLRTNKIRWDAEMFHIYGLPPSVDGMIDYIDWSSAVEASELTQQEAILQETAQRCGQSQREFHIRRKDTGELRSIFAVETVRVDMSGEPEWVVGTNIDVTERKRAEDDLRESERKYHDLINGMNDTVWVIDDDMRFLDVNDAAVKKMGYSRDELLSMKVTDIDDAIAPEQIQQLIDRLNEEKLQVFETRHKAKDGSMIPTEISSSLVSYMGRTVIMSIARDITERKQFENALVASGKKLKSLVDSQTHFVIRVNMEGRYTYWNSRFEKEFGWIYKTDDLRKAHVMTAVCPHHHERVSEIVKQCIAQPGQVFTVEIDKPAKEGGVRTTLWEFVCLTDESNQPLEIQCMGIEITERKRMEKQLKDTEKYYRALIEKAPDGVVLIGLDGRFKYASPAVKNIFGYEQDETLHGDPNALTHPDDLQHVLTELAALIEDPSRVPTLQYRFKHKNGDWRWIESTFSNLLALPGMEAIIINFRDIHERRLAEEALRKNEERLRTVADFTYDMEFWLDENKTLLYMSPSCLRITGYEREQFLKDPSLLYQIIHPDDRIIFDQHSIEEFTQPDSCSLDLRIIKLEGEVRWVSHTCQAVTSADGKFHGRRVSHRDITERRHALQELRASEEKYRGLLESLDSVVANVDLKGRFLYMNDMAAGQLGGVPAQFIGKTMYELFPEPVANLQMRDIKIVVDADHGMVTENPSMIQGKPRWYRTSIQPLHDENGRVVSVLINSTDIHDLKDVQQELQELNRTLEEKVTQRTAEVQDLYENSPTGYHSTNVEGKFVMVNQTELNWLGYTREEMIGHAVIDFISEATREIFLENFPLLIQRGWVKDIEFEFVRKDNSALPVSLSATSIYDEAGNFIMTRSTIFDNTERKAAENALRSINKELERALLVKDEFLANMSHELRTPLNGILGFSEILLTGEFGSLNEKQHKYIYTIESSGKHLLGLINDLLDLAKIEAEKLDVTLENVVISELCQASLMFVKQMALHKDIQLSFEQDMKYPYVVGDQRRLKQILVNLLSNAVKFTPEHGKVTLRVVVDPAKDCIGFAVEDTGIGISQADLLRLFKPFTQVDSSLARQHEGTGLGLALVQKLVELHGGGVFVQSEVGKGSTFTVCIPGRYMIGSKEKIEHQIPTEQVVVAGQGVVTGGKILLAEDIESNIVILGDYLEHQGYELIYARNGQEALEKVKETLPDLILMDIQMPVMDGLAATRRLRMEPRFATVPIIALTALAMTGDRERCLEAGATEYVSKPTNLNKLREMIADLLKAKV